MMREMTDAEVEEFQVKIKAQEPNTLVFEYALVCIQIGQRKATPLQREQKVLMEMEIIERMWGER